MSSERENRARAAARARLERQMAARREAARRRRQLQARIAGGVAAAVVIGAAAWITTAVVSGSDGDNPSTATGCTYNVLYPQPTAAPVDPSATASPDASATPDATTSLDATGSPDSSASAEPTASPLPDGIVDVGLPPSDPPTSGFQVMSIDTNLGMIQIEMDLSKTPCTAASMAHLASSGFYNKTDTTTTSCHRLVPDIFALQCGDPSATGYGGPNYQFANENLPAGLPAYHEGDVAMANGGADTNGSQFFFVYGTSSLPGDYTLWGHVITGLDIVRQVAAGAYDPATEMQAGGGTPTVSLIFNSVTVGPVSPTSAITPTPSATESAAATESPAATDSATPATT